VVPLVWAAFLEAARSSTAHASRAASITLWGSSKVFFRFAVIVLLHRLLAGLRFTETTPVMTIENHTIEVRAILPSPYCAERGFPQATTLSLFARFLGMLLFLLPFGIGLAGVPRTSLKF
jgi:hypothetical protein